MAICKCEKTDCMSADILGSFVTTCGRVYSRQTKRERKYTVDRTGRRSIKIAGQQSNVARWMLRAHKPCKGMKFLHADHIDDNKTNDTLDNLQWLTPSENSRKNTKRSKRRKPVTVRENMELAKEKWVKFRDTNVFVSNQGRLRRGSTISTGNMDGSGYLRTSIDGKQMLVHRVVAEVFHGPKLLFHVDHINKKRDDNRACNLEWVTPYENNRRARSVKRSKYFR